MLVLERKEGTWTHLKAHIPWLGMNSRNIAEITDLQITFVRNGLDLEINCILKRKKIIDKNQKWLSFLGVVPFSELLRNKTAFVQDVEQRQILDSTTLNLLMETPLPNNNLEVSQMCKYRTY